MAFVEDRTQDGSCVHVVLGGRLDLVGVGLVERAFTFATTARRLPVMVDVSEVTFLSSLGLGMMVGAARALARQGRRMVLVRPPPMIREILEASVLQEILPVAADEDHARALLR